MQLLVRCDNLELLAHEIHTKLPKGKKWLARKGLFHITVGILDSPSADKKNFLKMMNRTCPPASFMEGDCTCSRIEFENDRDDRANPPAVQLVKAPFGAEQGGAKHHAKEATITADKLPADDNRAISMLLSEAHDLTSALPPLSATIAKESKSGFTKLAIAVDSTQGQAARQQIQRIHDCIKQAYQRNPSMTLAKLELETNAYGNCLDGEDFVWKSKLHSLHASLERESVVPSSIGNSGHVQVAPVNVEKDYGKWPNDSHSGHKNTKSGILCYMSSGNIWVTLHLDPTPMVSSNLFPGDWTYFHISLAKLERLKVKTGGKSKHSHAVQLVKAPFGAEQGGAKHHAKEATITADKLPADDNRAISMLLSEAHDLTSALPPLSATIAKESKSGFTKLAIAVDSTQGQAARQQIQRIHDCIKQAYQRNPSMTLAKLELETNAYGNCLDGEDFVWKSKLHSLHASLERESVVPSSIGNSGHVQVAPVNVEKDYGKWPNDSHSGHKNTKSGILCYMSSGNIWVTLHLDPTPMVSSNLFPGDWTYFHISLAKLERLKVKTGGKSKHSHGKKKPGSSA